MSALKALFLLAGPPLGALGLGAWGLYEYWDYTKTPERAFRLRNDPTIANRRGGHVLAAQAFRGYKTAVIATTLGSRPMYSERIYPWRTPVVTTNRLRQDFLRIHDELWPGCRDTKPRPSFEELEFDRWVTWCPGVPDIHGNYPEV